MGRRHPLRLVLLGGGLLAGLAFAEASALPTVAVDLSSLDEQTYAQLDGLALEKRLVLRLVQDGFAVVAASADADIRVSLTRSAAGVRLSARGRAEPERRSEVVFGGEPLAEIHLEVAQKAALLARASRPPPPAVPVPPPPPRPRSAVTVGGSLGALTRGGGTDLAGTLVIRAGKGTGAQLVGALLPSSGVGVKVLEARVLVGPSVRFELGRGFELEGAVVVGVLLHGYQLDDPDAVPRTGVAPAAAIAVPVTVSFWPAPYLGLGLRLAPGIASAGQDHGEDWPRGQVWGEAGGMLIARF